MVRIGRYLALLAVVFAAAGAAWGGDFARSLTAELERRGRGQDLVKVDDRGTGLTVFFDKGAYDSVFRERGDEAFAMWFDKLSLSSSDRADMVAVVLTSQRLDGISSPKLFGHKFGFMETEGVVLMTPSGMEVYDNPWGTVGKYLGKSEHVDYGRANIGDGGETFIVGSRRYRNAAFTGLLVDLKQAANEN